MSQRLSPIVAAGLLCLAAALSAPPRAAADERHVEIGDLVEDVELPTLDGKRDRLLSRGAKANVFVFFRPEQEHSLSTLKELAACEKEFASKPVRFVGVVSDAFGADEVRSTLREAGARMPVLVDAGDGLYGKLGVRLHPLIGIVDARRKLTAWEPFRQLNYCERVRVRIRHLLGEVSEAEIARVDEPPPSTTRSEDGVARRHLNFARMLHQMSEEGQALAEVQKALVISPSAAAYALQGEILAALGKCPDAARAFEAALKIEPGNAVAQAARRNSCGG